MDGGYRGPNAPMPPDKADSSSTPGENPGTSDDRDFQLPEMTGSWENNILNETKEPEVITLSDDDFMLLGTIENPFSIYNSEQESQIEINNNNLTENCIQNMDAATDTTAQSNSTYRNELFKIIVDYYGNKLVSLTSTMDIMEREADNLSVQFCDLGDDIIGELKKSGFNQIESNRLAIEKYKKLLLDCQPRLEKAFNKLVNNLLTFVELRIIKPLLDFCDTETEKSPEIKQEFLQNDQKFRSNPPQEVFVSASQAESLPMKANHNTVGLTDLPKGSILVDNVTNEAAMAVFEEFCGTLPAKSTLDENPPGFSLGVCNVAETKDSNSIPAVKFNKLPQAQYQPPGRVANSVLDEQSNVLLGSLPSTSQARSVPANKQRCVKRLTYQEKPQSYAPLTSLDVKNQSGECYNLIVNNLQGGAVTVFLNQKEKEMAEAAVAPVGRQPEVIATHTCSTHFENPEVLSSDISSRNSQWQFQQNQISSTNPIGASSSQEGGAYQSTEKETAYRRKNATENLRKYRPPSVFEVNKQPEVEVLKNVPGGDTMKQQHQTRPMSAAPAYHSNPPLYQTGRYSGFEVPQEALNTKPAAMANSSTFPSQEFHQTFEQNQITNPGSQGNASKERYSSVSRKGALPRNGRSSKKKSNATQDIPKCEPLASMHNKPGNYAMDNVPTADRTIPTPQNTRPMSSLPSYCYTAPRYHLKNYKNKDPYPKGMDGASKIIHVDTEFQDNTGRIQTPNSNRTATANTSTAQAGVQQICVQGISANKLNIAEDLRKHQPQTQDQAHMPMNYIPEERNPVIQQEARPMSALPAYGNYPHVPVGRNDSPYYGSYLNYNMVPNMQAGYVQQNPQRNIPRYNQYNPQNPIGHQNLYGFPQNPSLHPHVNNPHMNVQNYPPSNFVNHLIETPFLNEEPTRAQNFNYQQNPEFNNTKYHPYQR